MLGSFSLTGATISQIDEVNNDKNQTFFLSWSPIGMSVKTIEALGLFTFDNFDVIKGEYGIRGVVYNPERITGLFIASYEYAFDKRTSFRVNLGYQTFSRKWDLYVDAFSPHYFNERFHFLQLMPEVKYNYVNKEKLNLFLSSGVGLSYLYNTRGRYVDTIEDHSGFGLGFQVWLLGFELKPVDNFVVRLCTVGYGTLGVVEFGLGYRF
jgi:hypothetical protein